MAKKVHDTRDQAEKAYGALGIGKGFVTYNKQVLPATAVENFKVTFTAPEGTVQLTLIENETALKHDLGIYTSEDVPVQVVKLQNLTNFVHSYENHEKMLSLVYKAGWSYRYKATPDESGKPFTLSQEALSLYQKSPENFLSSFGNAFINEVSAGVALYVMLQINFASADKKNTFQEKLGVGKTNIASVALALKGLIDDQDCEGSVNIRAIQLGGNPAQLSSIFASQTAKPQQDESNKGLAAYGFDFKEIEQCRNTIERAIQYTSELAKQVKKETPETLFFFGNLDITPYHAVNAEIGEHPQGMLSPETIAIRDELVQAYQKLEELKKMHIPFHTLFHFEDSLAAKVKEKLQDSLKYKEDLETFFSEQPVTRLCFSAGAEEANCKLAQKKLHALQPEKADELWTLLHAMNFSVEKNGQEAWYPISGLQNAATETIQRFVSLDKQQKTGSAEISVNHLDDQSEGSGVRGLYDVIGDDAVKQFNYKVDTTENADRQSHKANRLYRHYFISDQGQYFSFHEGFSFPHSGGQVCLHLPAGAWFVGTIHNVTSGESRKVPVFKTAKIKANVGDEIHIRPAVGLRATHHKFIVSTPNDTGEEEGATKLPLMTTVNLWGTTCNSKYSMVFHDGACR